MTECTYAYTPHHCTQCSYVYTPFPVCGRLDSLCSDVRSRAPHYVVFMFLELPLALL